MKRNTIIGVLALEAVLCVVFSALKASLDGAFTAVMAFPFEQIGLGLRHLSLSGAVGNVIAIVIYIALCLVPAAVFILMRKGDGKRGEDWLLVLISLALFVIMYYMINPGAMGVMLDGGMGSNAGKAVLGAIAYSVIVGYFLLRILRLFSSGAAEKLWGYMSVLLVLMNMLFVYAAFGSGFSGLLEAIGDLNGSNVGNEGVLGLTKFFLVLQFIVDALPYILSMVVAFAALGLIEAMKKNRYGEEVVLLAQKIERICAGALCATAVSNVVFNILQLLMIQSLSVVLITVQIPVISIAFVLAVMLLIRIITENKQLKDDNDLFV